MIYKLIQYVQLCTGISVAFHSSSSFDSNKQHSFFNFTFTNEHIYNFTTTPGAVAPLRFIGNVITVIKIVIAWLLLALLKTALMICPQFYSCVITIVLINTFYYQDDCKISSLTVMSVTRCLLCWLTLKPSSINNC